MYVRSACVLVLAVLSSSCGGCRKAEPAPASQSMSGVAVQLQPVRAETLRSTIGGPGIVAPASARDWTIYAAEAGVIAELPKAEGDEVKTGDILARFEYPTTGSELLVRQTELTNATARLDVAKAQLAKMSAMFDRGYAARNALDDAKNQVAAAELDVARARQQLDAANGAADSATIRARFPGVVAKRFHSPGDPVMPLPTDPVLRVIDPAALQVVMTVPVQDLDRIQVNQPVTITSMNGVDQGTVALRPTPDDPRATTQAVRIAFDKPDVTLPIDSPVQVDILIAERQNVPSIPASAIQREPDGTTFVMIAGPDGRAYRRDVRLGLTMRDRVEVVSGLAVGDRVVASDPSQVKEGMALVADR